MPQPADADTVTPEGEDGAGAAAAHESSSHAAGDAYLQKDALTDCLAY